MDAISEELITVTDDGPRLVASRCRACHAFGFPHRRTCGRCSSGGTERVLLGSHGTLWTWTVQTFRPKPPFPQGGEFRPFGVGYVELDEQLRVEAWLTEADPHRLRIGMRMELQLVSLPDNGVMFAFRPAA